MKMKIQLQPFMVPNYVLALSEPRPRQEGFIEASKWHIREVDEETLSGLCDLFRHDVFMKAEKVDPKSKT
jgi:hypothetical protein